MFTHSLRWKIHAWHSILLTLITVVLLVSFYTYEWRQRIEQVDSELARDLVEVLPAIDRQFHLANRPPDAPPEDEGRLQHEAEVLAALANSETYYTVYSEDGHVMVRSQNAPPNSPPPLTIQEIQSEKNPNQTRNGNRETYYPMPEGRIITLGTPLTAIKGHMSHLAMELTAAGIAIIGFGLAGGWWLAGRAIRPIATISQTAEKIAQGDLSQRINLKETENELGQLATVLNETFSRLHESFEQQVQFTADASHELRTPISVILAELDYALARERSSESYRDSIVTCRKAAERMKHLVNSLLELARADVAGFELMMEPCDLSLLVGEAVEFIRPLAQERGVIIEETLSTALPISADFEKLTRALINLLTNAVVHNPEGTKIIVTSEAIENTAVVSIADNGRGISAEALPHLFERFYREDKARSRSFSQGGTGLGLAITKAIIESHGGSIEVASQPGQGSEFVLRLALHAQ